MEIVNITYAEDDTAEHCVARAVREKIEQEGGLCVLRAIYFDENGADGSTPVVESSTMYVEGVSNIVSTFDLHIDK